MIENLCVIFKQAPVGLRVVTSAAGVHVFVSLLWFVLLLLVFLLFRRLVFVAARARQRSHATLAEVAAIKGQRSLRTREGGH